MMTYVDHCVDGIDACLLQEEKLYAWQTFLKIQVFLLLIVGDVLSEDKIFFRMENSH